MHSANPVGETQTNSICMNSRPGNSARGGGEISSTHGELSTKSELRLKLYGTVHFRERLIGLYT